MTEQQIIETLATKVMGWKANTFHLTANGWDIWRFPEGGSVLRASWNPLQNIADAWQVAEKLFIAVIPQAGFPPEDMKFLAIIDNEPVGLKHEAFAKTAPRAICRVALSHLTKR